TRLRQAIHLVLRRNGYITKLASGHLAHGRSPRLTLNRGTADHLGSRQHKDRRGLLWRLGAAGKKTAADQHDSSVEYNKPAPHVPPPSLLYHRSYRTSFGPVWVPILDVPGGRGALNAADKPRRL